MQAGDVLVLGWFVGNGENSGLNMLNSIFVKMNISFLLQDSALVLCSYVYFSPLQALLSHIPSNFTAWRTSCFLHITSCFVHFPC